MKATNMEAVAGATQQSTASRSTGKVTITLHENEMPAFAGPEIDRLYGHLLSSLSHFEVAKGLRNASTYVARRDGVPLAVLLYERDRHEVRMISEFVALDDTEMQRFTDHIFARFPSVRVVSFNKIRAPMQQLRRLHRPFQAVACTEDVVIDLPPTVEEYEARLGKNTRRNLKRYASLLQRDFPSYRYQVRIADEVNERQIRDIVELNRARMEDKSIVPRINEEETQWIVRFAQRCGIVGVATIDGRVCAGAIGFRIGDNYFMHVIAHDPAYNGYSVGLLCYYRTICEGIARGGKEFHLLLGRYEYKYRLLGETREIAHVDVYRSRLQALLHLRRIAKTALGARLLRMKLWLLEAERRDDASSRIATRLVQALRSVKRYRTRKKNP